MNKITLIGNLGRDPEMSYTPAGLAVTKFTLAISRPSTDRNNTGPNGERQRETDWYNITAFGKTAETCNQYLHKGNRVYVEGRFTPRRYTDKNGAERIALDVILNEMENLTPRDPQSSSVGGGGFVGGNVDDPLGDLDDHPF